METPCLKIKFTSLIKKLHKDDSKCCLEIVPEVACLQNFDKILRKQESSFFEYVIPMTYKIILKKGRQYDRKYMDCEVNHVYHSCVDLLHTSSSVDEAGDIHRIFSETMLLGKVTENVHRCNMILTQPKKMYSNPESKITASVQTYEKRDEFITLTGSNNSNMNKPNNSIIRFDGEKQDCGNNVMRNIDIQVDSLENIINVVKELVEKSTQNRSNQKVDLIVNQISTKSSLNATRILSLTPICSINTDDALQATHYLNSCNPNSLIKFDNEGYYKNICYYNYLSPIIRPCMHATYMPFDFKHLEPYKHTPEVRIAKFMKLMEDEILPLKCWLNNIVSKYTSLNIDNQVMKSLLDTKKVNQFENCNTQAQQRSNRVIYTIVFDG